MLIPLGMEPHAQSAVGRRWVGGTPWRWGGHGGVQRWRVLWDALLGLTQLWFQV